MKQAEERPRWFFVDEAGDPAFFAKGKKLIVGTQGCSKTLSIGFLRTYDPQAIRDKLAEIRLQIANGLAWPSPAPNEADDRCLPPPRTKDYGISFLSFLPD
jgi:hypothetical protein